MRVPPCFILHDQVKEVLLSFTKRYTVSQFLSQRTKIILMAASGLSNLDISVKLGIHKNSVSKWRSRFSSANDRLTVIANESASDLFTAVTEILKDERRSGTRCKFSQDQVVKIRLLACQNPSDYGVVRNH